MARCSWVGHLRDQCRLDAEAGKSLCIFHIPIEEKVTQDFWRCFANYYWACTMDVTGNMPRQVVAVPDGSWIRGLLDDRLLELYLKILPGPSSHWIFDGFVFPEMGSSVGLAGLTFHGAQFRKAVFGGTAMFEDAHFQKVCDFNGAEFSRDARFANANFDDLAIFTYASFSGDADFSGAEFMNVAHLSKVSFKSARFTGTKFHADVIFRKTTFAGEVIFGGARFQTDAFFPLTKFLCAADFELAEFLGAALFADADFADTVCFKSAQFVGSTEFDAVRFGGMATFSGALLAGPTRFLMVKLVCASSGESAGETNPGLDFTRCRVYSRLAFEGIEFSEFACLLLWDLEFSHGVSEITLDGAEQKGHLRPLTSGRTEITLGRGKWKGQVAEPSGEVVFKDIASGMNRVSFLHSEIYTDLLRFRFFNVKWHTEPEEFLFDANLAFRPCEEWTKFLLPHKVKELSAVFTLPSPPNVLEGASLWSSWRRNLQELVKLDVERIAREIRRFYETYGNYSDAGDYHIPEMDYRRKQAKCKKPFTYLILSLYRCFSRYGESPGWAFTWLASSVIAFSYVYLFSGFTSGNRAVQYVWRFEWSNVGRFLGDWCRSLQFALVNLVPGYFRPASAPFEANWTSRLAFAEGVLGITLVTLFLLALRRRFRR